MRVVWKMCFCWLNCMSSTSDSVSFSSSSSGSMRSREDIGRDVDRDIVSLEQVSAFERVCHGQEGVVDKFFYMPSISRLDAFTQSLNHFKDGFFKAVVKEGGRSYFFNADGSTKFPFSWTGNPWRYKYMNTDELSAADREVVEVPMKFTDRLPTKGLVRVYNSVHPIIDIEGHMPQVGKKNLTLFQTLRKEKVTRAKVVEKIEVPNLQESLVEVHVHGGTKRKVELPARLGRGKDVKKVWAALLGPRSSSGAKGPEAGLIELPKTTVRKDIEMNMPETLINSIDSMKPNHLVRTMVEFSSKALILGR
ncbi:hypothetical protein DEO72_LG6g630 [Vigna unguiculata]|uniref:Uncharacterized protein n=1 Tax=Vigna unguiculata TaxID=3917 RepID=A0A4D6M3V3_VIGUN|nr:hypothetical protein DEO72_LG6g630 [Vigna unguiculata]